MSRLPDVVRFWIFMIALMVLTLGIFLGRIHLGPNLAAFGVIMVAALAIAALFGRKVVLLEWGEVIIGLGVLFVVNSIYSLFAAT